MAEGLARNEAGSGSAWSGFRALNGRIVGRAGSLLQDGQEDSAEGMERFARTVGWAVFAAGLVAVSVLSLLPQAVLPDNGSDKLGHFAAYAAPGCVELGRASCGEGVCQ